MLPYFKVCCSSGRTHLLSSPLIVLLRWVASYLNTPSTRKTLGTDALPHEFRLLDSDVNSRFTSSDDILKDSSPHAGQLLERGVRVLFMVGAYDPGCSWVANERTARALEWYGQNEFVQEQLREWMVDGEVAGKLRSWGDLAFASVYGAGHMVRRCAYFISTDETYVVP